MGELRDRRTCRELIDLVSSCQAGTPESNVIYWTEDNELSRYPLMPMGIIRALRKTPSCTPYGVQI